MLLCFDGVSRQETRRVLTWLRGSAACRGEKGLHVSKERREYSGMGSLSLLELYYERSIAILRLYYDAESRASIKAAILQYPNQVTKIQLPQDFICT